MYTFDSPEYGKLAWILPPKTGTRSTEALLRRLKWRSVGGRHNAEKRLLARCDLRIANIRHPCDVIVSWYHYARKNAAVRRQKKLAVQSFSDWLRIQAIGGRNSYLRFSTLPGATSASEFVRYELGLGNEVYRVLTKLGFEVPVEISHIGAAVDRLPWRSYYTDKQLEQVLNKYSADFTRFGYEI